MQHVKDQFKSYRVISKVHLGSLEMDLQKNQVVEYDGTTMRIGNDEHNVHMLSAAIRVGWLVPVGQEGSYVSKPAGITIEKQDGSRTAITVAVSDEERNVGTLDSVRANGAPPTHSARNAGTRNDADGQVVGRLKSAANSPPIKLDGTDRQVVQKLDNSGRAGVEPVRKATPTGDVEEALTGENLEDLLPNAASAEIPAPGVSGEGSGDQSDARARAAVESVAVGGAETGTVVAAIVGDEVRAFDGPAPVEPTEPSTADSKEVRQAKLDMAKQLIPGFEWDLSIPWNRRAKLAVERHSTDVRILNVILSVETESVRKNILNRLYGK